MIPSRALLCLAVIALGLACVDLEPPWNKVSSSTGGSTGSQLDTGESPDIDLGGFGGEMTGAGGSLGSGGSPGSDVAGVGGGTATENDFDGGGAVGAGGDQAPIDADIGATGSGGDMVLDSSIGTGGTIDSDGGTSVDGLVGAGGALGFGGSTNVDGIAGAGGSTTFDSGETPDVPIGTGGIDGVVTGQGGSGGSTSVDAGTTVDASGSCTHASGVAVLTVPLTTSGEGQRFNYQNFSIMNTDVNGSYDLAGATLNIVACAPDATGGNLHVFFTTPDRKDSPATDVALSTLTTGFTTISIPVPAASGDFDPTSIMVTRIEVEAGSAFGTSWQSPATVIYIDSISTSNGLFNDTFDSNYDPLQHSGARNTKSLSTVSWVSDYAR